MKAIRPLLLFMAYCCLAAWLSVPAGMADWQELGDPEMEAINGSGGLSVGLNNIAFYLQADKVSYTDTDTGNALELGHLLISNGRGGPARVSAGIGDIDNDGLISPLTFDVLTVSDPQSPIYGKSLALLQAMDWLQETHLHVQEFVFCGQELGSLDLGVIHRPSFYWLLGAHDSGVDFEYAAQVSIDALRLTYNSQGENMALAGIHMASQVNGAPEDPSQWQVGGMFQIGAIHEGNPATFDVGSDSAGMAGIEMNLPMRGSLRMENIQWAGQDFGPVAIDGIQVHRLNIRFTP